MTPSRGYSSARRTRQAQETQRAILTAARRLFGQRGYAATTLKEIAADAGVSVPTLYASIGNKTNIALSLVDFVEREAGLSDLIEAQNGAKDGAELVDLNVRFVLAMKLRCGDVMYALRLAEASDPGVRPGMQSLLDVHREGQRVAARRLIELRALREGLGEADALGTLMIVGSPDILAQLIHVEGWSDQRAGDWLRDSLTRLLLPMT